MNNIKIEFIISLITGIISSIISSFILSHLILHSSQEAIIIFLSVIIVIFIIAIMGVRAIITRYQEDITDFLTEVNRSILFSRCNCSTEKDFHYWVKKGVEMYLNAIPGLLALKYKNRGKLHLKKSQFFAALFFYNEEQKQISFKDDCFHKFEIYDRLITNHNHIKHLSNDIIKDATQTIFGWVLDPKKTRDYNIKRKAEKLGDKIAWCPRFIQSGINEHKYVSIKSGFSMLLEYQGRTIGILGVGATENCGIWLDECIYIQQIGFSIIQWLIHMESLCPWHRKGWRQINTSIVPIKDHKFNFSINQYTEEEINKKLDRKEVETLKDAYKERINIIKNGKINDVYIAGTFNGWRKDHLKMTYNESTNEWQGNIHLPKGGGGDRNKDGYYEYCYIVNIDGKDYWIFDASADIKKGEQNNINSILIL